MVGVAVVVVVGVAVEMKHILLLLLLSTSALAAKDPLDALDECEGHLLDPSEFRSLLKDAFDLPETYFKETRFEEVQDWQIEKSEELVQETEDGVIVESKEMQELKAAYLRMKAKEMK